VEYGNCKAYVDAFRNQHSTIQLDLAVSRVGPCHLSALPSPSECPPQCCNLLFAHSQTKSSSTLPSSCSWMTEPHPTLASSPSFRPVNTSTPFSRFATTVIYIPVSSNPGSTMPPRQGDSVLVHTKLPTSPTNYAGIPPPLPAFDVATSTTNMSSLPSGLASSCSLRMMQRTAFTSMQQDSLILLTSLSGIAFMRTVSPPTVGPKNLQSIALPCGCCGTQA
jgi:hypothetical protein